MCRNIFGNLFRKRCYQLFRKCKSVPIYIQPFAGIFVDKHIKSVRQTDLEIQNIRMKRMTDGNGTQFAKVLFSQSLCLHHRYYYRFVFRIDSHIHRLANLNGITGTLQTNVSNLCSRIIPIQLFGYFCR